MLRCAHPTAPLNATSTVFPSLARGPATEKASMREFAAAAALTMLASAALAEPKEEAMEVLEKSPGRVTFVIAKRGADWQIVQFHRSAMPN